MVKICQPLKKAKLATKMFYMDTFGFYREKQKYWYSIEKLNIGASFLSIYSSNIATTFLVYEEERHGLDHAVYFLWHE